LWPPAQQSDGIKVLHHERRDVLGTNCSEAVSDPLMREFLADQDRLYRFQDDRIIRVDGDITIEPRNSLAYLPGRKLVGELQGVHPEVVPSISRYLLNGVRGRKERRIESVVHFDGFLGRNVWHFFSDAFNPLLLWDNSSVNRDAPILIHRRIHDRPIAKLLLSRPPFAGREWLVQDGQWIRARSLYKGLSSVAWFRHAYDFIASFTPKGGNRRIFLNRRQRFGRNIANIHEIEVITRRHGFETVYAEDLPFEEQVELFAQTRAIVSIHGAGLTNLMFADVSQLRCLEIQTKSYLQPHYYWMLQLLGAERYDAIAGSTLDRNQSFHLDSQGFERQLSSLIE
jgi:hypothetical protein